MTIEDTLTAPLPTRLRQRLLTRRVILDAAVEEIAERGLEGARIEAIARRAGVTRPTVYAHFPSRSDFLREIESRTQTLTLVELRSRLGGPDDPDLPRRLVDALCDLMERSQPTLRREVFAGIVREPASADWLGNPLFGFLSERFAAAQRRGEITAALPAPELTRIAMTALFGFLAIEAEPPAERRAAAHRMMALLMRGAAAR